MATPEAGREAAAGPKRVTPPSYLPDNLRGEFRRLAKLLIELGNFSKLDYDSLARYLIAQNSYLNATVKANSALKSGRLAEAERYITIQDKYFKQCRGAARDLGMTVNDRGRLNIPPPPEVDELFG